MIDVRATTIIYQSQIYYRDLLNSLVLNRRLGKALDSKWEKADLILGYLEALNYRHLLTDEEDILNVNYILECLIKLCELNYYPVVAPLTFQEAPAVIVGKQGDPGTPGLEGPQGPTGLATDFSVVSTSITSVVDSFDITDAYAARWDYWVKETGGAQRVSSILAHWLADGTFDLTDMGADDIGGSTSGVEFNISISGTTVQLVATITSGTWTIVGSRYFIPNNGNGSGPISDTLLDGRIYIGNALNIATGQPVSGVINITNTGVTSFVPNIIQNGDISLTAGIALTKLAALNPNIVPITDGSGFLVNSALSPTTLGFVDIGSSLTGLLNLKLTDPLTTIGDLLYRNGSNVTARLGAGTAGQVLTMVGAVPAWTAAPGGISGLTTNYLPKATSATTLGNSIISEVTGAITVAGTTELQGGFRTEATGSFFKIKKIVTSGWNMDLIGLIFQSHGITAGKILSVSCKIVDGFGADNGPLNQANGSGILMGTITWDSTFIFLTRFASSVWDSASFTNATAVTTIIYEA